MNEIYQQVYKKFPEVSGKKPVQHIQPNGQTLLVFKGSVTTEDGKKMTRSVRVLIGENGKIIKMTTSR